MGSKGEALGRFFGVLAGPPERQSPAVGRPVLPPRLMAALPFSKCLELK